MDVDFRPLIEELGIDKLPPDDQKEILAIASRTVFKRVVLRLAMELTDEQTDYFEEASKNGDKAALEALLQIYPNFPQVYQEEVDGLKRDMLGVMPDPQPAETNNPMAVPNDGAQAEGEQHQ